MAEDNKSVHPALSVGGLVHPRAMTEHRCDFPFDESDLDQEVECHYGCGRRMKVVMVGEGELALQATE